VTGAATAGPRVTGQPHFSIVAMAASAGGVTAMTRVLRPLPASLPVPIVAVEHLDPRHETVIAEVLRRRTALGVKLAEDGERAHPGTVYVAPPNRHLLVQDDGSLALSTGEMVHFLRPCADLLFESVAGAFG
jgi:two-component system, chemotaxis family, protein-glutamate methylesterase/glutaminase